VPKVSVPINRFEGGLNNRDSARDIGDNFLAEATNVDVSSVGRIRPLGEFKNLSTSITIASSEVDTELQPGYGLFKINVDGPPEASGTTTTGEHLVYVNGDAEVYVGPTSNALAAWHSADLGSVSNCKPVFYYADGGLRISDSELGNASETVALQRLVRSANGYAALTERMDLINDGFAGPVNADFEDSDAKDCVAAASGEEDGENPSSDFLVQTLPSGTDGLWPASTYTFGASYVYYGNQESKISTGLTNISADGTITLTDGQFPNISVSIGDGDVKLAEIQGMRIYLRDINNPDDEFTLLLDIDFEQGSRISLADDFDPLVDGSGFDVTNDAKNVNADNRAYAIKQPGLDTYATINGYSSDEKEISFNGNTAYGYKTAVVANQRAFVGNVDYVDSEGRTKVMGDRIQYTPVRKYDLFPQSFYLDIGTNDGDEIVKLAEFKDKLFVYKKDKLFVINIASGSDAGWYVEAELENRGVQSPGAVCKSDLGLVWVNEHGMFSYSEQIQKLSSTIDDTTWQANIEATTTIVGYIPKKNQILVVGNTDDTTPVGYLYDIQTKSIVNINHTHVLEGDKITNFVVYGEELVCLADSGTFKRYDPTPAAQTINIKTKEVDFKLPSVDKRFYSIYATYINNGNTANIKTGRNGASPSDEFITSGLENVMDSSSLSTEEFILLSSNRDGKSLQIQIDGTANASFELQDLSIILRAKGQR